jgi:LmbE family N-acetylglucosaminyl deacetylase
MEERLDEDREALGLLGIEPDGLGYLDGQYRSEPLDQQALNASIAEAVGDATEVWSPAGIGGHADHVQVREAALALGRPVRFYAELPYAVKFGWPAWVSGGEADPFLSVDVHWRRWLPQTLALEPRVHRLAPEEADRKLAAARTYRTQFPGLDRGSVGFLAHPAVIGFEVSWA